MARIFLSYAREDVAKAKALAGGLERHDHEVWWDRRILGGSRFSQQIEAELKRADVVLVVWSRYSAQSAWVQDEAAVGRDSDRLVPVAIDDSLPPLGFRQYHAIDLSHWNGRSDATVVHHVHEAIAGKVGDLVTDFDRKPLPPAPEQERWRPSQWALALVPVMLLALVAAIYWPSNAPANAEAEQLRVRLAAFSKLSPDLPDAAPQVLREELLAALATDAIVIAGSKGPASSEEPAGYAVSASVRKIADQIRFTVHLMNEQSGDTLWTAMFDRPLSSMEVAPRQTAVAVSQVLRCGLTGQSQYPESLPDQTLAIYLTYCQESFADTAGKVTNPRRGLDLARRVVQAAPDFSRGWSARARMARLAAEQASEQAAGLRREADSAARRALELDARNSEAYSILALLVPFTSYAEREKLYVKSVSVRPGDCGCEYVAYSFFLSEIGRNEDALQAINRAQDMVPFSADANASLAESLFTLGRNDEAHETVQKVLEVWPNNIYLRRILIRTALWTNRYGEALEAIADPLTKFEDLERQHFSAAFRALQSGSPTAKEAAIEQLLELGRTTKAKRPLVIATLAALGGEREAIGLAANTFGQGGSPDQYVLFEPAFAEARQTPEFAALVERIGLVRYWRQTKRPPDFCRERNAPSMCRSL